MTDHERELPGLQAIRAASSEATKRSEEVRIAAAIARVEARAGLALKLQALSVAEAGHFAERIREATHGSIQSYQRMVDELERLGVLFPAGTK